MMKSAAEQVVYSTGFFEVVRKKYGSTYYNYVDLGKEIVSILPIIEGNIIIERQYRPAVGRYLYEIPAGHLEKGEKTEAAAARELEEETGYKPGKLVKLLEFHPSPGLTNEKNTLYLATNLRKGKRKLDKNERLSVIKMPLEKALSMVDKGAIIDAKTIIALLYYAANR